MDVKFASHCSYQIRYHQVFCVKYRKQILRKRLYIERLREIIIGICERYRFEIDEIGTDGDHIHLFVGSSPKWSPSEIMQAIKSITAKEIFKSFSEIKKILRGGAFWSEGGYIGTVGEGTNEDIVRKYIKRQGNEIERKQHKQLSLFSLRKQ